MVGQCVFRYATRPSTVIPSIPGAPRLRLTWRSARWRFSLPSTRSMRSVPSTGASAPRVPPSGSSPGLPRDSSRCLSDTLPRIDTTRLLLSFPPLTGPRSGLRWGESSRVFRPCRSWLVSLPVGSEEARPQGRWPPSAAQTARAVFPHAAFTKARRAAAGARSESAKQDPPAPTRHGAAASGASSTQCSATACTDGTTAVEPPTDRAG